MSIELKIKSKHLSAESKIIRQEELKLKKEILRLKSLDSLNSERIKYLKDQIQSISEHRKDPRGLRGEARATHLAHAFCKGRKYSEVEKNTKTSPNWKRVDSMVKKYSNPSRLKEFQGWWNT